MADRSQGILLDSSAIIAHFRGKLDLFQLVIPGEPLFLPLVALGELWKGALKSADPPKHQAKITALLKIVAVINPDSATAGRGGKLRRISTRICKRTAPVASLSCWNREKRIQGNPSFPDRDKQTTVSFNPMKVVRKNAGGESREVLLKEYFVTASLIALLKRVGAEAARMAAPKPEPALVRVRR